MESFQEDDLFLPEDFDVDNVIKDCFPELEEEYTSFEEKMVEVDLSISEEAMDKFLDNNIPTFLPPPSDLPFYFDLKGNIVYKKPMRAPFFYIFYRRLPYLARDYYPVY